MVERLCLLTVHAHPDDEASKGAATVARYHAAGVRTVLVTCTGGEEGDVLNPAMDRPEVRADIAKVRRRELERAARIIGYDEVVLLGYRDSGMPGSPANDDPRCFARAPLDEAVGRLVEVVRRVRPQVVVTYGEDQRGYPHPDHLRAHEVAVAAFAAAGDPAAHPEAGPPYEPLKLYYTVWSRERMLALHERFVALGLESPFAEGLRQRPGQDDRVTTRVDVRGFAHVVRDALLAHESQVDPASPFWFGLPPEVVREVAGEDLYELAQSRVPTTLPEDDLFAGVAAARPDPEGGRGTDGRDGRLGEPSSVPGSR